MESKRVVVAEEKEGVVMSTITNGSLIFDHGPDVPCDMSGQQHYAPPKCAKAVKCNDCGTVFDKMPNMENYQDWSKNHWHFFYYGTNKHACVEKKYKGPVITMQFASPKRVRT